MNDIVDNPIETKALKDLKPLPFNPRKISEEKRKLLEKSLRKFGDANVLTWNKQTGHIVGGNERLAILKSLGIKSTQVRIVDLPENEEKALAIHLNTHEGEFDYPRLREEITKIDLGDLDMELTGFRDVELKDLFSNGNSKKEKELRKCPNCGVTL